MEQARHMLKLSPGKYLMNLDKGEWISLIFLVIDQDHLASRGFDYCQYVLHDREKEIVAALQRNLLNRGGGLQLENCYDPILQALYLIGRYDVLVDSLGFCLEHSLHQAAHKMDTIPSDRVALFQCFQGLSQYEMDKTIRSRLAAWICPDAGKPVELTFCRNLSPHNYFDLLCDLHAAFELEEFPQFAAMLKPHLKPVSGVNHGLSLFEPASAIDYDNFYAMPQQQPHGLCLIINVKNFLPPRSPDDNIPLEVRRGSDIDQQRLEGTFKLFGFNVIHLEDPGYEELCTCFAKIRTDDRLYSVACLAVCVMTHGDEDDNLYLYDRTCIPVTDIRKLCYGQALIGKPRLYFVQACRGDQNLRPVFLQRDATTTSNSESDCLISTATVKGYSAMRSQSSGSWYITDLCAALQEYGHSHPLKTVLMKTRNKLQKRVDKYAGGYVTQISEDKSTLIKEVQLVCAEGESFYDGISELVLLEITEEIMDWLVCECITEFEDSR